MDSDKMLDEGKKFRVRMFGIKVPMKIRQLPLNAIMRIERESHKIEFKEGIDGTVAAFGVGARNIKPKSRIVAYAILRSSIKSKLFSCILAAMLRESLTSKDLDILMMLTLQQSEIKSLFHATTLAKSLAPAAGVVTSPVESPSGGKSPESRKASPDIPTGL